MKKNIAVTPYIMPIFLWSTVNTHDFQPVVETGRRNAPNVDAGVTGTLKSGTATCVAGRSMMAIVISS
jgi:hypothetical protein